MVVKVAALMSRGVAASGATCWLRSSWRPVLGCSRNGGRRNFAAGPFSMSGAPTQRNVAPRTGGSNLPAFTPRIDPDRDLKRRVNQSMPTTITHYNVLQRLAEQFAIDLPSGGLMQQFKDRQAKLRANNDRKMQEEIFEESKKVLMAPERWTYGNMAAYQRKLLHLMGAYGWRRRLAGDDPSIQHLEKELKVLEAMTPVELASNHKSVFNRDAIKLIAEKAGVTERFVNNVIMGHDVLRADRRWYMILEQFGKKHPQTFEDRQHMAEYDRPFSESEKELRDEMLEKQQQKMAGKKPKRVDKIYYRHPSRGGNRWSTKPPRWYPAQWRMRPERQQRLAGVGHGGGGDRGRPWGRLGMLRR